MAFGKPSSEAGEYEPVFSEYLLDDESFETYVTAEEDDILAIEVPCTLTISAGVVFQ